MPSELSQKLIADAIGLENSARRMLDAASKLRQAASLLSQDAPANTDLSALFASIMGPTTTTPLPPGFSDDSRRQQLNSLLLNAGPMQRHVLIDLAERFGIPKSTSQAYITRDNFSYQDGFWWIKGKEFPPKTLWYGRIAPPEEEHE